MTPAESLTAVPGGRAHARFSVASGRLHPTTRWTDWRARKCGNDRSPSTRSLLCASSEHTHARALGTSSSSSSAEPVGPTENANFVSVNILLRASYADDTAEALLFPPTASRSFSLSFSRFVRSTFRRRRDTRDPYYASRPSPPAPASPRRVSRLRSQSSAAAAKSPQGRPPGGAAAVRNFARRVCRPDDYARAFVAAAASFARVRQ